MINQRAGIGEEKYENRDGLRQSSSFCGNSFLVVVSIHLSSESVESPDNSQQQQRFDINYGLDLQQIKIKEGLLSQWQCAVIGLGPIITGM